MRLEKIRIEKEQYERQQVIIETQRKAREEFERIRIETEKRIEEERIAYNLKEKAAFEAREVERLRLIQVFQE